jgi:penicillin-binding protein 2D
MRNFLQKRKFLYLMSFLFIILLIFLSLLFIRAQEPPEIHDLTSIEFYSNDGTKFFELTNQQSKNYTDLENISPYIIDAIISIEDQNFYDHNGFNYSRIVKALFDNLLAMKNKYGASTITQQYARNLYLSFEKTYTRKLKEAYYTILLESNYAKNDILEGYLNTIYFGHGVYGVSDAAYYYFNKSIQDITIKEASVLAAIIKAPTYYSPITNFEQNEARSQLILDEMLALKKITKEAYETANQEQITIIGKHPQSIDNDAPYFQDMVTKELEALDIVQDDFYRGVKVYTTLDLKLNQIIKANINAMFSSSSSIETAVFAIDPRNGFVQAVVGGRDYEASQFNRATSATRHPGSTIKPLLYYKALEYGFTPTTTLKSEKTTFYLNTEPYSPINYQNEYPNDYITMAYALATSDNIYAVKTHLYLGQDALIKTAKRLGLTTEMEPLPSLALGATDVKLSELTTAYAHFASMGKQVKPTYITKVTDMEGNVLYEAKIPNKQVLDPDITFILNDTLTGMFDRAMSTNITVTGHSIASKLNNRYSGKSGSTDYDNLMIGYNPYLVLGVWAGYDDHIPINNPAEKALPKHLWANIMSQYFTEPYEFFQPTEHVVGVRVNPITGIIATRYTFDYTKVLYYIKGTQPNA